MYIVICDGHIRSQFRTQKQAKLAFRNYIDFLSCCKLYKIKRIK